MSTSNSHGGYNKNRKKVRNTNKEIPLQNEGQYYGRIVKKYGSFRYDIEIYAKKSDTTVTKVTGVFSGILKRRFKRSGCVIDDYVLCIPNYSGPSGKDYGIVHIYKSSELPIIFQDNNFKFPTEQYRKEDVVEVTTNDDFRFNYEDGIYISSDEESDDEDEDFSDEDENLNFKENKTKKISLDDL